MSCKRAAICDAKLLLSSCYLTRRPGHMFRNNMRGTRASFLTGTLFRYLEFQTTQSRRPFQRAQVIRSRFFLAILRLRPVRAINRDLGPELFRDTEPRSRARGGHRGDGESPFLPHFKGQKPSLGTGRQVGCGPGNGPNGRLARRGQRPQIGLNGRRGGRGWGT